MRNAQVDDLPEINSWEELPKFQSEAEEAEFWGSHAFGPDLLAEFRSRPQAGSVVGPLPERTRPVAIRFDADVLSRLRTVAQKKGKGYQTLLKEFVVERLYEEERREGILPPGGRSSR